ncbi:MAG: hypothetical protein EA370_16460 [Wenzhouxiangella sp.]|nr:MAG: hypothetical protein EA370_16460 [Wenzhouxiangella sp.]
MSRYHYNRDVTAVLAASDAWRDECLLEDGSVFSNQALWTPANLAELNRAFIQNALEGGASYFDKLKQQLVSASPPATQLMAELHWVLLLFPHNINPATKRTQVMDLWALSGETLTADHPMLSDEVLAGTAHAGTAYNTHRWREMAFLIQIAEAFKVESLERRSELLSEPWVFSKWLASVPRDGFRQFRHIIRWMLFPDTFERICTSIDKRAIVEHYDRLSRPQSGRLSDLEMDQRLLAIRKRLEEEHGDNIDLYDSPWIDQWKPSHRTWLIAWNPKNWEWENFQNDRLRVANGESVTLRWSSASAQLNEGDTFYLVRLGQEPRGLIARGNIASETYEDAHYDPDRAARGDKTRFVDVTLTDLRDPTVDPFIGMADLQSETTDNQRWSPQSSGIEVKPRSAKLVGTLWSQLPPVKINPGKTTTSREEAIQIKRPVNQIFYGPPGTGKTYHLRTHLMPRYESEARRAPTGEWLEAQLAETSWWEAVALALADLGGEATVNDLLIHPYFRAKARVQGRPNSPNLRATCWSSLQIHTVIESETVKYAPDKRQPPLIFDKKAGGLWTFAGDWEEAGEALREQLARLKQGPASADAKIKRHLTVTFHQSYSYEDFIEGIRPQASENGQISYEVRDGLFKSFCKRARQDPRQRYALFIDEINRGNIARIFGELITLIEVDKRAWWDEDGQLVDGIELTLPYSGDRFGVPKNLDIYATMNTADRSIALMDAALRRRFHFHELMPEPKRVPGSRGDGVISDGEGGLLDLRSLLESINQRLRYLLHRDQTFGHAYFIEVKDLDALRQVMVYDIIPMLAEYFYDDWSQIRRVLSDDGATPDHQLITVTKLDPAHLFPDGDPNLPDKIDYRVRPPEEITADALRKIYEQPET